nr:reverse transcriptase domain-containing protein [Tanacetum cinerariifolium]
ETFTDLDLAEYTIKVPPPRVPKSKPPSQREFVVHQRDPLHPNIPYPSRILKQKQKEKDEVQIQNFWQMFKQLHVNITFADALILMPKYQKMLKALLSNKEKLQELANTPLNENCSAVILKKLPEKQGDPGKFLILCGFSELKCKALADLGASINLMPLSVWKKLGLPELISTRMTLELANRAIFTPTGIARDVFVLVGKFTFLADFVIVDYESDPRVPLILGRPFLRTARALIDVHGCKFLSEIFPDIDVFNDIHPHFDDDPLSGSTTYSANSLLEEFTNELALITYPLDYDDNLQFDIESDLKEIEFLLYQESKLLMDELDLPCDSLPYSEFDSFKSQDFSRVDNLPSPDNEDKVFNPGILIHEKSVTIITHVAQEKKLEISYASLVFKDFKPPFYTPRFFKDVFKSRMLLPFSTESKEKVFKPGDYLDCKVSQIVIHKSSHPQLHFGNPIPDTREQSGQPVMTREEDDGISEALDPQV